MGRIPFTNRQSIVKVCVVGMLGLAILLGSSSVTLAREKKQCNPAIKDVHGCSPCDLQSRGATSCLEQAVNDAVKYPSQTHIVKCGPGGKQCCIININTGKEISCRAISNVQPPIGPGEATPKPGDLPGTVEPGPRKQPPPYSKSGMNAPIMKRGVEGEQPDSGMANPSSPSSENK